MKVTEYLKKGYRLNVMKNYNDNIYLTLFNDKKVLYLNQFKDIDYFINMDINPYKFIEIYYENKYILEEKKICFNEKYNEDIYYRREKIVEDESIINLLNKYKKMGGFDENNGNKCRK